MVLEAIKRKIREDPEISNAVAGGIAGAITATVVCPLDVLKTRLQVQGKAGAAMYRGVGGEYLIKALHPPPDPAPAAAACQLGAASGAARLAAASQYSYEAVAQGEHPAPEPALRPFPEAAGTGRPPPLPAAEPLGAGGTGAPLASLPPPFRGAVTPAERIGMAGGLSKIMREEGMRGLYRGLTPTLVALLPNWAVYFTAYERLKQAIGSRVAPQWSSSAAVHMAAAAGAGAATMLITNPLWVIKTRLQTQNMGIRMGASGNPALYRGTMDAFVRIAREEGVVGLYSGLGPSLLGVMHVVIQFPLYESLKARFAARHADGGPHSEKLNLYELILASATSKMIASTATYPHEVVRSRMHIAGTGAFTGLMRTCRQILAEDGVAGFYRGCMTNLLRTTPAAAVTFTSFELINRQLKVWAETPAAPPAAAQQQRQRLQQQRQQQGAAAPEQQQQQQQQGQGQVGRAAVAHHAESDAAGERPVGPLFAAASSAAAGSSGGVRDPRQLSSHTRSLDDGGDPPAR